ncbi:MAG: outer membrane protein assembly factor BamB family protein, partial [Planctomycetota bacterium]
MKNIAAILIPVIVTVAGILAMQYWLSGDPTEGIEPRLTGGDGRPKDEIDANEPIKIEGVLTKSDGVPADIPGSWPRFRGADYDAISKEDTRLARTWPENGPEVLWSIKVGEGYASPAIMAGRVYLIDYDEEKKEDAIRCLSLADGKEIWRYSYPVKVKWDHGMSRGVPTVTDKYLVTIGPKCHVTCLDSMTGEFRWMYNLAKEFDTKIPQWYTGQCPVIENDRAIIAPGGETLMMAVDCNSGEITWKTTEPNDWIMTH